MIRRVGIAAAALGLAATVGACGSGDDDDDDAAALETSVRGTDLVITEFDECRFDGDRQVRGAGTVRNRDDAEHHISLSVRFIDGQGVRVDIASDSVSDLQPGETAQWDASIYSDNGDTVERCEVTTEAS